MEEITPIDYMTSIFIPQKLVYADISDSAFRLLLAMLFYMRYEPPHYPERVPVNYKSIKENLKYTDKQIEKYKDELIKSGWIYYEGSKNE